MGKGSGVVASNNVGVEPNSGSKGCGGGMLLEDSRDLLMRLGIVLVATEKAGGDSIQPIGRRVGIATRGGSLAALGKGTAKLSAPDGMR